MEYVFEPRWSGQEQDSSAPSEPQPAERSLTQNMMSLLLNTLSDSVDYQEIGTGEAAAPDDARHRPFGVRRDGRGALVFSADFEDGNIDTVDMSPDGMEYEINLRHDSLNPKYVLWFHFQVTNCFAGQQAIISVINFSKGKSVYRHGMTPVVRSTHRPEWRRLPQRCVYYYRSPMHDNNYVLSIIFTFDKEDDVYEFAYSYPYTYTQLQHDLAFWDFLALPYLRRACLCRTPLLKRLDLLTIAEPMMPCALLDAAEAQATPAVDAGGDGAATGGPAAAAFGGSGSSSSSNTTAPTLPVIESLAPLVVRRKAVAISCRIHPGETPPSHVLCGFLNFVLGPSPEASALRSALTFVVVPMLNPDGVFLGNYRADAGGLDLNRQWLHAHPDLTPSLHHWCQLLLSYDRHPSYDLDICIDMHAHSNSRHSFMYVNAPSRTDPDAVLKQERINKLPRLLDAMMTGFRFSACSMDDDPSKAGCARRVLSALLPGTECYTLEISFYHSNEPGAAMAAGGGSNGAGSSGEPSCVELHNTVEGYHDMGRQMGLALLAYYGLEGRAAAMAAAASSSAATTAAAINSPRASLSRVPLDRTAAAPTGGGSSSKASKEALTSRRSGGVLSSVPSLPSLPLRSNSRDSSG